MNLDGVKQFFQKTWTKIYEFYDKNFFTPPNDENLEWHETALKIPKGKTKVVFDVTGFLAWEWNNEVVLIKEVGTSSQKKKEKVYLNMLKN